MYYNYILQICNCSLHSVHPTDLDNTLVILILSMSWSFNRFTLRILPVFRIKRFYVISIRNVGKWNTQTITKLSSTKHYSANKWNITMSIFIFVHLYHPWSAYSTSLTHWNLKCAGSLRGKIKKYDKHINFQQAERNITSLPNFFQSILKINLVYSMSAVLRFCKTVFSKSAIKFGFVLNWLFDWLLTTILIDYLCITDH